MDELLTKADAFVRERISDKRYAHTLRVADTAERLAKLHGLDAEKVRLAALLHDAAREFKKEEFPRLAKEWNLPVGELEQENPKLLHGPVAAELARRELGLEDEEILEAIRVHTVGESGMSKLALALYVADKIEPARNHPSVDLMRDLAERDLYTAAAETIRRSQAYNEQKGKTTHPASVETLEWLEMRLEQAQHLAQRRMEKG